VCAGGPGFKVRSRQARLQLTSLRVRYSEKQLVCSWVTATEDVWHMQPEEQTITRGSLAVSADAFEIAIFIQGVLELFLLHLHHFTIITAVCPNAQ